MSNVIKYRSFCRFCVGLCGIEIFLQNGVIKTIRGDKEHLLSKGYTCIKGRSLGLFHQGKHRLTSPFLQRRNKQTKTLATWDKVFAGLAQTINRTVNTYGANSIALYAGTAANLDWIGRWSAIGLLRALGSHSLYTITSIDTACRSLVAELLSGHAGLNPIIDEQESRCTLLIGINPPISHGHTTGFSNPWQRLKNLASHGNLIVIDPQISETSILADQHVRLLPGTDYVLLAYLVRELLIEGYDKTYASNHITGIDQLTKVVSRYDIEYTGHNTGLEHDTLIKLTNTIRTAGRIGAVAGTGLTMSKNAVVAEWLLWCLLGITGSLDRPGGVWFNPGFMGMKDQRNWKPARHSGSGPASRPDLPSRMGEMPCAALADEIDSGNIRVLLVAGGNPLTAMPNSNLMRNMLQKLDALAVCDVQSTATTEIATHIMPATCQLERADSTTYLETCLPAVAAQFTKAVLPPPGDAKPMWWIFAKLVSCQASSVG
ncbi:MAG: molybdopterin-containing oxidoreductase family protein [Candidatus Anammoxibacter sp.]